MPRFAGIPQDEKLRRFVAACREHGLSVTHQRLAIYGRLAETVAHPSAEHIFEQVRLEYPTISLATVYKTLETLEGIGLVRRIHQVHEAARFDANPDPHHHLICAACHRVLDYYDDALSAPPAQAARVAEGFQIRGWQIQFTGMCAACGDGAADPV